MTELKITAMESIKMVLEYPINEDMAHRRWFHISQVVQAATKAENAHQKAMASIYKLNSLFNDQD